MKKILFATIFTIYANDASGMDPTSKKEQLRVNLTNFGVAVKSTTRQSQEMRESTNFVMILRRKDVGTQIDSDRQMAERMQINLDRQMAERMQAEGNSRTHFSTLKGNFALEKVIGDGSCGYRAIDSNRRRAVSKSYSRSSRRVLLNGLINVINEEPNSDDALAIMKLVIPEIKNLFDLGKVPEELGQLYEARSFLTDIERFPDQDVETIGEIDRYVLEVCPLKVPDYLRYLRDSNRWSELPGTNVEGGHISGGEGETCVLDAIAYMQRKNLIIVSPERVILHNFRHPKNIEDTVYLTYSRYPGHFDRLNPIN